MTAPLYYYHHNTGCGSITGGAFVPAGIWPEAYDQAYLFGDFNCGRITRLVGSGAGATNADFVTDLGSNSVVDMVFAPHAATQALFYTTYGGTFLGGGGQLRRIVYTGAVNQPPAAVLAANPVYGAAPLDVTLSAFGTTDADPGDTLVYDWDLGDGTPLTSSTSLTVTHLYDEGIYTATLRARDQRGALSETLSVRIDSGNTPPMAAMTRVGPDEPFAVGELLEWTGAGTDAEDLSEALAYTWEARLHHIDATLPGNAHFHPYLALTPGAVISFTAPAPEDFGATALSYVELILTVTDTWGLSAVVTDVVEPRLVTLNFAAAPDGLELLLRGQTMLPPQTATSWENWAFEVAAPLQTDAAGAAWGWQSWEVGGGLTATRTITTPAASTSYSATFTLTDAAPVPLVIRLEPPSAPSGVAAQPLDLTVIGKNFASDAVILWDSTPLLPTTFISSTQLQAPVGVELLGAQGPVPVSVSNPAPGGGDAEPLDFLRWWQQWLPLFVRGG